MERTPRTELTALVVDDDVVLRSTLAELLEEEGAFKVIQASNGFSGLRLATEHRPQLVVLDLIMPELSGVDVLRELRSAPNAREMAIVVLTGSPETLTEAQLAETDGVVRKPFDIASLLATLNRAVLRAANRGVEVQPVIPAVPGLAPHRQVKRTHASPSGRRPRGRL